MTHHIALSSVETIARRHWCCQKKLLKTSTLQEWNVVILIEIWSWPADFLQNPKFESENCVHMKFKLQSTFDVHNVRWGFSRKEGQKNMHYWLCIITIVTFLKSCVISSDVKWSILKFADWFFLVYGHWADFIQLSKFWILRIDFEYFGRIQQTLFIYLKSWFLGFFTRKKYLCFT